jgi:anthranilate synthase component I
VERVPDARCASLRWSTNMSRDSFLEMVARAKEEILAGEIFQIVVSQRWSGRFPTADALALYRTLRSINPSPYMFLLRTDSCTLVGSSPEMLVRLDNGVAENRPIAGTRRRGATAAEDRVLEEELLADPKERAEHLMLVDLGRNDLGRVCESGTVQVSDYAHVERYSHVMHIVSNVEGKLREDMRAIDLFLATFPAGTVSGAPKIRAMELIDALEPTRRGPYAGAVAYFGFSGSLDSCIAIRTAVLKDDVVHIQAGAGIVYDSVAESEYDETVNKSLALRRAVDLTLQRTGELTAAGAA